MIVGELGCQRCRYVGKMGRTPNGDNLSEKWEVQVRRLTMSEVYDLLEKWVVGSDV